MEKLWCNRCKQFKDKSKFRKKKNVRGFRYWCTKCERKHNLNYYYKNIDKIRGIQKRYREKYREKLNRLSKEWGHKNREKIANRKHRDKIELIKMLGGRCQNPNCSTPNGYNRSIRALSFHHLNPEEKEGESDCHTKKGRQKIIKLWKEGKIKLLCENCHRELHEKYKNYSLE